MEKPKKGGSNSGKEAEEEEEEQQQLDTKTITKQVPSKRCFLWVPPRAGGTREPWELELRFVFVVGIDVGVGVGVVVLRAVSQAIKRNITAMRTSPKRTDGDGRRTKLSREETSANWVRWDRLSSCRVEVPPPLLLLVRFFYVTPTPPSPPSATAAAATCFLFFAHLYERNGLPCSASLSLSPSLSTCCLLLLLYSEMNV